MSAAGAKRVPTPTPNPTPPAPARLRLVSPRPVPKCERASLNRLANQQANAAANEIIHINSCQNGQND